MNRPLLVLDSFGKSFGERVVLHSASLWGTAGRITVLLGRNGSGKSTLIRLGLGTLAADHGVTRWEDEAWERPRLHELARRGLFFLPDRGLISKRLTLRAQLDLFAVAFGSPHEEVVELFDLGDLLDLYVGQLSGGEERRAELALVRLRRPRCLIADEPFSGVSPMGRARVAAELQGHAARGAAVIVTGHEVEDLLAIADEVVWMVAGTTHVLGTPDAARRNHEFRRDYLGPTRGMGSALTGQQGIA